MDYAFIVFLVCFVSGTLGNRRRAKRDVDEVTSGINQLVNQLNNVQQDTAAIKSALEELKTEVSASPSTVSQVSEVVNTVGSSLTKFTSGDAFNIVSGCLDLLSTVASTFGGPYGIAISAVISLVSSILSLFAGDGFDSATRKVIEEAFKTHRDQELRDSVNGARRTFNDVIAFLKGASKHGNVTEQELEVISKGVPLTKLSDTLGILESRINRGSTSTDAAEAERTVEFIFLYLQLATMRDTLITNFILILKQVPAADTYANAVSISLDANKESVRETIDFLHNMEAKNAVCGAYYYPIYHSEMTKSILSFAKFFGLPDPPRNTFGGVYRVQNRYWPTWYICKESYMGNHMFRGCSNVRSPSVQIRALENGYQKINLRGKNMYITKHAQGWAWGTADNDPGEQGYFVFVPLKSGYYMISTKKWPNYFVYMESSASGYIRSWNHNPGLQGHWRIL
uniref:Toxin CfTX-A n=1 Tax=Chironex fleckeri TaxID=45396 RepID=JTX2A_CHIFL|nr:RecName: Full=Toxin CfTX-A; AltName: Full=Toxin A; Short=TX-A; Flags: Precursor [Chironex fleckeri]AFQ00676.1 toxin A precursor [Chironex fleckeri]